MIYKERTECIFCESKQLETLLSKDFTVPLGNFAVDSPTSPSYFMPYNVQVCEQCGTVQTKYIGDLQLIYENNFAGAHGSIRSTHTTLFSDFITSNKQVQSITEIGAGNGELADSILEKRELPYTVVDPSFGGNKIKKTILPTFFESCKNEDIQSNTLVLSHVFEHFYNPRRVLQKFQDLSSIEFIYLSFPDLEAFIEDGTYHVLNSEHTFYVRNQFLKEIFEIYGFSCKREYLHARHSVFFEFVRNPSLESKQFPVNKTTKEHAQQFFQRLFQHIEEANTLLTTSLPVYIWPCSMHTLFTLSFGLTKESLIAVLDNSPLKIGKYLYGHSYKCLPFQDIIHNTSEKIILLTGGCYTQEVLQQVQKNSKNKVVIL
jgi:hypothetical protein